MLNKSDQPSGWLTYLSMVLATGLVFNVGPTAAGIQLDDGHEWAPGITSSHRPSGGAYMVIVPDSDCAVDSGLYASFYLLYCGSYRYKDTVEVGDMRATFRDQQGNILFEVTHQPDVAGSAGFGLYHEQLENLSRDNPSVMVLELSRWEKDVERTELPVEACAFEIDPHYTHLKFMVRADGFFGQYNIGDGGITYGGCDPIDTSDHYLP